jgi:glycosyltransferase involved in cell wall biosynthesis
MHEVKRKKILILSQGPVPTPEHTKVEGGGLRCWGLAKGLNVADPSLDITVAYNDSYIKDKYTDNYENIKVKTWKLENIPSLIDEYDSVIVSYCMGDLSTITANSIRPDQQLVLDCYVPIYVEASARDTINLENEYYDYYVDVERWDEVLKHGDVFLCSSAQQKAYYKGVLSALGRINPVTYGDDSIVVTPYGIYRDEPKAKATPISKQIKDKSVKKILWFGGIYPWFDLRQLIDAIKILNKSVPANLVIVGAKNPFNSHPDILRKYDEVIEYIQETKTEDLVVMQDWIKFDDRADWYLDSDLVVVINKEGEENKLSWRTRLVDFMWANLPVITNAGDPLGETMIEHKAAIRFSGLNSNAIAKDLENVLHDDKKIKNVKERLSLIKSDYYWDVVTKELADKINEHYQPKDRREFGKFESVGAPKRPSGSKVQKVYSKARMLPAYANKYGWRNTYYVIRTIAASRVKRIIPADTTQPRVVFISHQLDISGAPFVFMDLLKYLKKEHPKLPLDFYTFNPAHHANIAKLNKDGIKPKILMNREVGIGFNKGDVAVLNTTGHSQVLKNSIFGALENNTLKKLVWYIHEDQPELIFNSSEKTRIKKLLASKKLTMFTAGQKTQDNYQEYFGDEDQIKIQYYKVEVPKKNQHIRTESDFDKLRFLLPGTVGDGRKGHLPVLYALMNFKTYYYDKNPDKYRDFSLEFIGLGPDFLSRQIENHAPLGLGEHFTSRKHILHEDYLEAVFNSNVTICYSLREALPLFVFEGMYAGHVIMRNDSSGMIEQLDEGKNGYYLDTNSYQQVVESLEEILNKEKTSNKKLADMSKHSYEIAAKQADNNYDKISNEIYKGFSE